MNRRSLMKSVAIVPMLPLAKPATIAREVRSTFLLDDSASVQMIVTAHPSAVSAEEWRRNWQEQVFESRGEWYRQGTENRELPAELELLPGSMRFHTYVWGEAGEDGEFLIGAFRHDHIGCVIRIKSDDEEAMIQLGTFFAEQPVPEIWELIWNEAQMQAFIPTTESLGMQVEFEEGFWP